MSTKLERILGIDEEIKRGTFPSVYDLCAKFEIAERTVHEDIRYLKERLNRDIQFDRNRNGYFNGNPDQALPTFELTSGEIFALTLGKELLSLYVGTSFESVLRSALNKVSERLPETVRIAPEDVKSIMSFRSNAIVPVGGKLFTDMQKACDSQMQVEISYFAPSTGEISTRVVEPQLVLHTSNTWYLVAYCTMRKALRLFALHRIRDYALTEAKFAPVKREELDNWLNSAFQVQHGEKVHDIKIHFAPNGAHYIRERNWHPNQVLENLPDGSCELSFPESSLEEVYRWLAPYGSDAIVLAPEELRTMVAKEAEKILHSYSVAAPHA
jgi:predicted DNA-binding transcriptional regulator YafY